MQLEACKRQLAAPLSSRVKGNFDARFRTRGEQWQHSPRLFYKALSAKTNGWYERLERIDYKQTSSLLTGWKKTEDLDFLNEVSCVPLQQCLRHLQKAFANFWGKRAKYPRFKAKRNGGSAEFTKSAFKFRDGNLWLAKCFEPLNIVWSRFLPQGCTPSTVTVKLEPSGRWFVSLLIDDPTIQPLPPIKKQVGIDVGVSSLITTSDGEKIANPKHFNRLYQKLKVAQKELSRKTKGSNNRYKARLEVARIHSLIKDARTDFLHKLTTDLVRANSVIAIEDLAIRNMVKNHKLALRISDSAWGEMFRQLEYKCEWYGRKLVKIDRFFPSSKRCNHCGFVMDKLPLDVRSWDCPSCKTTGIDRDVNASQNILAAGLAVIVCGADIRPDRHSSKGQLRNTQGRDFRGCLENSSRPRKRKKQKPKS
ncbi:transposase [Hyella patelloides LEGE 07179]|uniref:Transposase n=1 Tax=Hyella patelloides LEGE 07179 TaxID=945734 RepID=A0A563VXN8_9CYAN|nr:transposase [Hyella patelloides]VEP16180.1 transposase [Hyella patelloides LEGE 07179]